MTKKILAAGLATFFLASCTAKMIEKVEPENPAEREFAESGRAKAIENKTDLWQIFENAEAGFSVKFPAGIALGENLQIRVDAIAELGEQPLNFTTATAELNRDALARGEFGEELDWPLAKSKRVKNLGAVNAQDFLVLGRFEICDVIFERTLVFYSNDRQIVLTLVGDPEKIIGENAEFFATDSENCGEMSIWNFEKQPEFFAELADGNGGEITQKWFDDLDAIAATIEFFEPSAPEFDAEKLAGKWTSLDDPNSTIEFAGGEKIDFVGGVEMSRGKFEISGDGLLTVDEDDEIFEYQVDKLDDANLILLFLPRGNFLRFAR